MDHDDDGSAASAREPSEPGGPSGPGSPPYDVLDEIDLEAVFALGSDGTERVDWASLVVDRSGECPECGKPDGPRHYRSCIAHPRRPSRWWMAFACFVLPLPLVLVVGPGALVLFAPVFALAWYIATR
jgi:hypothetical protein